MRVAVSGPGGTGKSTLTTLLSTELNLSIIGEGVYEWLAEHATVGPWSLSYDEQLKLQRYAIGYKIERERAAPSFISDRTTIDAVTLLTLRFERFGRPVPEELRELALSHARTSYDVALILGPHRVSPLPDDVALLDPTLRQREYDLTLDLYRLLGITTITIAVDRPAEIAPAARRGLQEWVAANPRRTSS
jgi:nicotinamide riboside kinase